MPADRNKTWFRREVDYDNLDLDQASRAGSDRLEIALAAFTRSKTAGAPDLLRRAVIAASPRPLPPDGPVKLAQFALLKSTFSTHSG